MLEIKNLSVGYGQKKVLCNLTATFEKGKLTSVIGVNGCGKSTLLKAVINYLPTIDGDIFIDGKSISLMSRNEIAKKIAYLSQGRQVPDMTVEQMVLHGRFPYIGYPRRYSSKDRDMARSAMEKVGILDLAEKPLSELSGGMRQSAYIAMALTQDTDYILLDEPTTYLDVSHQISLIRLLRELADGGKGIVTVMHDLPIAFEFSDGIAVMGEGRILSQSSPEYVSSSSTIKDVFGISLSKADDKYFYGYNEKQ